MQFGSDDLAKYTFLPEAGNFVRDFGISISDLSSGDYAPVLKRAEERVLEAMKQGKISTKIAERETEIMSFPVSLMLVKSTNLDHIMSRYAQAEAARIESFLKQERNPRVIEEMFKSSIGIELEHNKNSSLPQFKMPIAAYVKRAAQFHKTEWKLVNKTVGEGRVYLSQEDLIRLIREEIRTIILQRLREVRVPKLPENLAELVRKIIQTAPPPPRDAYATLRVSPENYPPCVRHALEMLDRGESVPHYGRFLMATYLLSVGKTVDEIVALFPKAPNFKASVTRYQVEHLAGLKGGRTRYRVPSCSTLVTNNFCFKDPIKCYEIKNPLQFPSKVAPPGVGSERLRPAQTPNNGGERQSVRRKKEWTKTQRKH